MYYPLLSSGVLTAWLMVTMFSLFAGSGRKRAGKSYWQEEAERISREARQAGVHWGRRETGIIWLVSLAAASSLYFLTGNLLLFGTGWLLTLVLPGLIIDSRRRKQRLALLTALTDCLRQLLARMPDQGSLVRGLEVVTASCPTNKMMPILQQVLDELRLGSSVRDAIELWRRKVELKKFDHVAETIIQANKDGWTPTALQALDKSVQALEADLRAVVVTTQKAAARKRQLYTMILTAWSFPVILSLMRTGQKNVYLHTLTGKILIFLYVLVSLYVVVKGQEYLSLNVEEL